MSKLLEQLHKGEVSQTEAERRLKNIRSSMAERTLLLTELQLKQGEDKREAALLSEALEAYNTSKKEKRSQYIRAPRLWTLEEVFPLIGQGPLVLPNGDTFNTNSMRYKLFRDKGVTCVTCGLKGEYFAQEKDSKESRPVWHWNLYGLRPDGAEVLFTRDHIKPRSLGGPDIMENLQTMCSTCNCKKGSNWEENNEE